MEHPLIFTSAILWMIVWGTVGGVVTPRIYLRRDLDVSQAGFAGATIGAATGPFGLVPVWLYTPKLRPVWSILSIIGMVARTIAPTIMRVIYSSIRRGGEWHQVSLRRRQDFLPRTRVFQLGHHATRSRKRAAPQ